MIVRELVTRLGFSADNSQLTKYERSMSGLTVTARNLVGIFAAGFSLRALQQAADETQSIEARIAQLPQTIGDAGAAFETVAQHAIEARQQLKAYADVYTRIGNAAQDYVKSQGELLQLTDTLSKALVVGGATAQEQASAFLQFSQGLGSGALQGDEFRAMAEAAPQYMDALAKAIGVPRGELKKLGSEGKLTTQQIISSTLKMTDLFDKKFREMPMTIGQATTVIASKFDILIARFNRKSHAVTKIANALISLFDAIGNGVEWVAESTDKFAKKLGGWEGTLRVFAVALALAFAPAMWAGMAALIGRVTMALQVMFWAVAANPMVLVIGGLIVLIALLVDDIWGWVHGTPSMMGELLGPWQDFRDKMSMFIGGVIDWIRKIPDEIEAAFKKAEQWIRSIENAAEGMKNKIIDTGKAIAGDGAMPDWSGEGGTLKGIGSKLFRSTAFGAAYDMYQGMTDPSLPGRVSSAAKSIINFTNNITLQTPAGSSQQDKEFWRKTTDEMFRDFFADVVTGAMSNLVRQE